VIRVKYFSLVGTIIFPGTGTIESKGEGSFVLRGRNRAVGKWETCFRFSTFPSAAVVVPV
jgi:hypothetical protein